MATQPGGQPAPEQREHTPRFSPDIVRLGNTIFDGVSNFDEHRYSIVVRLTMSARAYGTLTQNGTFKDLGQELQSYLMFRVHNEEQKEREYLQERKKFDAEEIAKEDEKYRVKYTYEDTDQPELVRGEDGEWIRKDFL